MKILVIGETCLDVFVYGSVERLAPEAPAPVLKTLSSPKVNLGMAGNVRENVLSLGAKCELITNSNYASVTKTRFVDDRTNTLFLRHDVGEEKITPATDLDLEKLSVYDAVIISDYDKGFLSRELICAIGATHPLVFLDTKKVLGEWCKTVHTIKINSLEYENSKSVIESSDEIRNKIVCTSGNRGSFYRDKSFPVPAVEIKDLSGAGDTFLAGLVVKYIQTKSIEKSIEFANNCATRAVQTRGVFSGDSASPRGEE